MNVSTYNPEPPAYSETGKGGNISINIRNSADYGHHQAQPTQNVAVPAYQQGQHLPIYQPAVIQQAAAPAVTYVAAPVQHTAVVLQPAVVPYCGNLGDKPCATTCPMCSQRIITNVDYKSGSFSWLMCFVFIILGLMCGCCVIPFFVNSFRDAHHSCPNCRAPIYTHERM